MRTQLEADLVRLDFGSKPAAGLASPAAPAFQVSVRIQRAFSAALCEAGVPFIAAASASGSSIALAPQIAVVHVEGLHAAWELRIPELRPGAVVRPAVEEIGLVLRELEAIYRPRETRVELHVSGRVVSGQILLLPAWHWPLTRAAYRTLAAFVLPNDSVVRMVMLRAKAWSLGRSGRSAGTPAAADPPRAAFEFLLAFSRIAYASPAPGRLGSEPEWQEIRPPHRIFRDLRNYRGEGNCLDLSLLMAGVLEAWGEYPVVVLVLDDADAPVHAVIGWWGDHGRRFRPLLTDTLEIRELARSGALPLLEVNCLCEGMKVDFESAAAVAERRIAEGRRILALDVCAFRPPFGSVLPFEQRVDPTVGRALSEAALLASRCATPVLETLHLLGGLISAEGDIGRTVLRLRALEPASVIGQVEQQLSGRPRDVSPARTRGYDLCLADAAENARAHGSSVVREGDLWWSLLRSRSPSVLLLLAACGSSLPEVTSALAQVCPDERPESGML